MSDQKTLEEMEQELEDMQASECRRAAVREQEHQRQLRALRRKTATLCLLAAVVILGALGALAVSIASVPPGTETAIEETAGGMATAEEAPPEGWATDGNSDGGVLRPLPRKPFEEQKRPPCDIRRETELVGACWLPLEGKPGEDLCGIYFHHDGKCYAPVKVAEKAPSSMDP
jgi:hypothetical protein